MLAKKTKHFPEEISFDLGLRRSRALICEEERSFQVMEVFVFYLLYKDLLELITADPPEAVGAKNGPRVLAGGG